MTFRERLLRTLRAVQPVLDISGVLVAGSEVPNLLESNAASTLVVSQDVDLAIPVARIEELRHAVSRLSLFVPSPDEPSVLMPKDSELIEVNLLGLDPTKNSPDETYVFSDRDLPLMVFGALGLLAPGRPMELEGIRFRLPRPAGLIIEKLLSDRTGEKGHRDLLVVLALLIVTGPGEWKDVISSYGHLSSEFRHTVRANLAMLSLLGATPGMFNPEPYRNLVSTLLSELEQEEVKINA